MDTLAKHKVSVKISFDDDAQVWWIEDASLHGLRLEDSSLDALMSRIPLAIADLLEARLDLNSDGDVSSASFDVVMNVQRAVSAMPHAA